jgi:hypothetical protein
MKYGTEKTHKRKFTQARHRILVFTGEVRTVPARRRSINPLFLQAHDYETFRILACQPN